MRKTPIRTYIAAMDFLRLSSLEDFWVIGSGGTGETVLREILTLQPDLLILAGNLAGMDGLKLLEILGDALAAPPRVLYLWQGTTAAGKAWMDQALQAGADCAACESEGEAEFFLALKTAREAIKRTPRLAKPWEAERLTIAEGLLDALSIPDALKGKAYLRFSCAALACAPQLAQSLSSRLYPYTARAFQTTPQAVERAMRTAVEYTWLHGDLNAIGRLFGLTVDADRGKPTNAEFLSMLAEHVRREIARRMARENPKGLL